MKGFQNSESHIYIFTNHERISKVIFSLLLICHLLDQIKELTRRRSNRLDDELTRCKRHARMKSAVWVVVPYLPKDLYTVHDEIEHLGSVSEIIWIFIMYLINYMFCCRRLPMQFLCWIISGVMVIL